MKRNWITMMQGGREIERPVHINNKGNEYVRVHGKKLLVGRLKVDGRIINKYSLGAEET